MTISLSQKLTELPNFLPLASSTSEEKYAIKDVWEKMIIHGEGFDPNNSTELRSYVIGYLKNKSACGGNFIRFCDQFCKENIIDIEKADYLQKERILAIFKTLGKEYIEQDQWGVHPYKPLITDRIKEIKLKFNFSSIGQTLAQVIDIISSSSKEFFFPWSLSTIPIALSRYRTVQQCHEGIKKLSMKLGLDIPQDLVASVARFSVTDNRINRDRSANITDIKCLQARRIASTMIRVTLVAVITFMVVKLSLFLIPTIKTLVALGLLPQLLNAFIIIFGGAAFLIVLLLSLLKGTLSDAASSLVIILNKLAILAETIVIPCFLHVTYLTATSSITLTMLWTIATAVLISWVLKFYFISIDLSEDFSRMTEMDFYKDDFDQDTIKPIIDILSKGIQGILDPLFARV